MSLHRWTYRGTDALNAAVPPPQEWQPIATAPRTGKVFFWIVPKTADEMYTDSSGKPIPVDFQPYRHFGAWKTWSASGKAILWHPDLPAPPAAVPVERKP